MKEQLIKIGRNEYCFIDEEGYEFPIELERIPYTDDEAFVETFDLDLNDIKDPVIRLEIEGLENALESPVDGFNEENSELLISSSLLYFYRK